MYYLPSTQNEEMEDMRWGWTVYLLSRGFLLILKRDANKILSLHQSYIEIYDTPKVLPFITTVLLLNMAKRKSMSISLSEEKKEVAGFSIDHQVRRRRMRARIARISVHDI